MLQTNAGKLSSLVARPAAAIDIWTNYLTVMHARVCGTCARSDRRSASFVNVYKIRCLPFYDIVITTVEIK